MLLNAYGADPIDFQEALRECLCYAEALGETIQPIEGLVNEAVDAGQTVLFEGAQGTLLDVDFGTYPFVTASTTTAGGVFIGSGLRPQAIDRILGVFKAYTTRVGAGPMPTELTDDVGEAIRQKASEFGVTTGRARRVGWFDAVAGRYSTRLNGLTEGAVTRLDVLDDLPAIGVCNRLPHARRYDHRVSLDAGRARSLRARHRNAAGLGVADHGGPHLRRSAGGGAGLHPPAGRAAGLPHGHRLGGPPPRRDDRPRSLGRATTRPREAAGRPGRFAPTP